MMLVLAPQDQPECPHDCKGCTKEEPHNPDCAFLGHECGGCVNEGSCDRS